MRRTVLAALIFTAAGVLALGAAQAQFTAGYSDPARTRAALAQAQAQSRAASARAVRLEAAARDATQAAQKTAQAAAALAARIQQAEAGIAAGQAQLALVRGQRAALDRRLAIRRGPLVRLTASLQKMARRPLALAALRPGSLRDTVYLRAMLAATLPEVRQRTAALRAEIARSRQLEMAARAAVTDLNASETVLGERRQRLAALEPRQRLASRQASGAAAREAERALALAEQARDLDTLVARLDAAGSLRETLAALPGPIMRPPRPERSEVVAGAAPSASPPPPRRFELPVTGRTVTGFGEAGEGGVRSSGIALAPADGAQVVAPAAGRVAFAGPYRGYDRIVIIEHDGGFTSLVTGLARTDVSVGDELVAGAPLGVAGAGRPVITFELRRAGQPVNPVQFVG
ncbi:MAG: murein hydrolase activator EnvC family protein [Tsuneonella sp.]